MEKKSSKSTGTGGKGRGEGRGRGHRMSWWMTLLVMFGIRDQPNMSTAGRQRVPRREPEHSRGSMRFRYPGHIRFLGGNKTPMPMPLPLAETKHEPEPQEQQNMPEAIPSREFCHLANNTPCTNVNLAPVLTSIVNICDDQNQSIRNEDLHEEEVTQEGPCAVAVEEPKSDVCGSEVVSDHSYPTNAIVELSPASYDPQLPLEEPFGLNRRVKVWIESTSRRRLNSKTLEAARFPRLFDTLDLASRPPLDPETHKDMYSDVQPDPKISKKHSGSAKTLDEVYWNEIDEMVRMLDNPDASSDDDKYYNDVPSISFKGSTDEISMAGRVEDLSNDSSSCISTKSESTPTVPSVKFLGELYGIGSERETGLGNDFCIGSECGYDGESESSYSVGDIDIGKRHRKLVKRKGMASIPTDSESSYRTVGEAPTKHGNLVRWKAMASIPAGIEAELASENSPSGDEATKLDFDAGVLHNSLDNAGVATPKKIEPQEGNEKKNVGFFRYMGRKCIGAVRVIRSLPNRRAQRRRVAPETMISDKEGSKKKGPNVTAEIIERGCGDATKGPEKGEDATRKWFKNYETKTKTDKKSAG